MGSMDGHGDHGHLRNGYGEHWYVGRGHGGHGHGTQSTGPLLQVNLV